MSYNKIKRLQPSTLRRIGTFFDMPKTEDDIPRKINLVGNPFICDCNLREMFDWLGSTTANLYRRDNLRCYTGIPEENAGMYNNYLFYSTRYKKRFSNFICIV